MTRSFFLPMFFFGVGASHLFFPKLHFFSIPKWNKSPPGLDSKDEAGLFFCAVYLSPGPICCGQTRLEKTWTIIVMIYLRGRSVLMTWNVKQKDDTRTLYFFTSILRYLCTWTTCTVLSTVSLIWLVQWAKFCLFSGVFLMQPSSFLSSDQRAEDVFFLNVDLKGFLGACSII